MIAAALFNLIAVIVIFEGEFEVGVSNTISKLMQVMCYFEKKCY